MAESSYLESDRQARRDALDVTRSFIVQAPAGSGKTELLIQRYLCLLATVTDPEEVVAITFTRKAASEMLARVVEALERARRGEVAEAAHEQVTLDAARRILSRDSEFGWRLLEMPRRMRIQTLDALCASITRLLPVSSGLGGAMTTSADAAMQRLYREAAMATLDWLPDGGERAKSVERVLAHLDNTVSFYIDYLARMLAKREQWLGIVGIGGADNLDSVRAALEQNIEHQVSARLRPLRERMQQAGGAAERELLQYAGGTLEAASGDAHPLAQLDGADWPPATGEGVVLWRAIASQMTTLEGSIRKRLDKNCGFPTGDSGQKQAFASWLKTLADDSELAVSLSTVRDLPDIRYADEQWEVLVALFGVLPLAVGELQRLFSERGVTDHVEVAQAAAAALGSVEEPGELAMLLDYRIRHLLVDEMQDTSIGQYRLLAQLAAGWEAGDGRTLFCVGDPMQSIYRFRDAEVGQFVAARTHGIGEIQLESLVLRQNFRSGERLVDWFNTVFSDLLPARDDISSGAISYSLSVATDDHAGRGAVAIHPLVDAGAAEEAACTATIIEDCLHDHEGNVAVLVRGRSHLPDLLADLRLRGVECEAVEIDRLTDLPEIIDLLALTRALCHEGDRLAWLALLRAPWVGLTWTELHALVRNDRDSTVLELVREEERIEGLSEPGRQRLQALVNTIMDVGQGHGSRLLRERVEMTWQALGGPACLTTHGQLDNVYRFLDVLEKIESTGTLADVALLEAQLDDERVSSVGSDKTRVQVMTMHKAKGLQFDHVVLHGLGRRPAGGDQDVLSWLNVAGDDGSGGMIISPLGPRSDSEKDPLHRFIERSRRESDAFEVARLLYVACTRARHSLHLVGSVQTRRHGAELGTPPASTLLHRLWPLVEPDFETCFANGPSPDAEDEGDRAIFTNPLLWRLDSGPLPLPATPPGAPAEGAADEREVSYDWVGSDARHAGTIVHRWLQWLADRDDPSPGLPDNVVQVSRRWARVLGVADADIENVIDRARQALAAILADDKGRWLLAGPGHAELRLSGIHDGRVTRIVIDRVRIDGDVHWIVDYKTSTHEGGDLQGFLRQQTERYRDQLQRYRDIYRDRHDGPVRAALYFPLLQSFVEVDVDPTT